jgi:hypothetical protein
VTIPSLYFTDSPAAAVYRIDAPGNITRALRACGIVQRETESLACAFARALGITALELKTRLQETAYDGRSVVVKVASLPQVAALDFQKHVYTDHGYRIHYSRKSEP